MTVLPNSTPLTPKPIALRGRRISMFITPIALIGFSLLLFNKVMEMDLALISASLSQVTTAAWTASGFATLASFLAVGQYDAVMHKVLRSPVSPLAAQWSGMRAIALSQTLGFGSLTGALVRWRCLPSLNAVSAMKLSVAVSVSFLVAWALVTSVSLWFSGADLLYGKAALLISALLCATLALTFKSRRRFPKLRAALAQFGLANAIRLLGWTLVDTGFAALALALLLPESASVSYSTIFAAYLVALGAGLISNAPGGVGAFDLCLLALLPQIGQEPLLASLLAFRVVYYLVPALLALCAIALPARAPKAPIPAPLLKLNKTWEVESFLADAPAEWRMVRQQASILCCPTRRTAWLVDSAPKTLVALGDALNPGRLSDLSQTAKSRRQIPALYKVSARQALRARQQGWSVLRTGALALLNPMDFSLETPKRRQLRRKLRAAEKNGVSITKGGATDAQLAAISNDWVRARGAERGFSMGRFERGYIARQVVFVARQNDQPIAFVTFHSGCDEWTLDLIRSSGTLPDGTIHLLINAAINEARKHGIKRLSLAAISTLPSSFGRFISRKYAGAGLEQFKRSFAPNWSALYMCAPSPIQLTSAGLAIAYAIHRPRPLEQSASDHKNQRAQNSRSNQAQ